jgi:hypothetical protein
MGRGGAEADDAAIALLVDAANLRSGSVSLAPNVLVFRQATRLLHLTVALAVLLLAASTTSCAAARRAPRPDPGDRIRVTATGIEPHWTVGRFIEIRADALVFEPASSLAGTPRRQAVPLPNLRWLEVSRGMTGSRTVLGIAAGALIGGLAGALAGSLAAEGETAPILTPELVLGVAGGGLGAVVGGVVGHRIPAENWVTVPLDEIR